MRFSPVGALTGTPINFLAAQTLQTMQLGARLQATDSDYSTLASIGNGGGITAMYVRCPTVINTGRLVHVDKDFVVSDVPVTAGTGRPVFVVLSPFGPGASFGWVGREGAFPVQFSVPATAGPVFAGASGQASPTAAAGRQLLNATTLLGSAAAFTRFARTRAGLNFIVLNDTTGIFPGMAVSGAGIPGGAVVAGFEQDNTTVRLSVNCTASASVNTTFTHTGYGIVQLESAFVQGQIT